MKLGPCGMSVICCAATKGNGAENTGNKCKSYQGKGNTLDI